MTKRWWQESKYGRKKEIGDRICSPITTTTMANRKQKTENKEGK
jgi:hypothetical protein